MVQHDSAAHRSGLTNLSQQRLPRSVVEVDEEALDHPARRSFRSESRGNQACYPFSTEIGFHRHTPGVRDSVPSEDACLVGEHIATVDFEDNAPGCEVQTLRPGVQADSEEHELVHSRLLRTENLGVDERGPSDEEAIQERPHLVGRGAVTAGSEPWHPPPLLARCRVEEERGPRVVEQRVRPFPLACTHSCSDQRRPADSRGSVESIHRGLVLVTRHYLIGHGFTSSSSAAICPYRPAVAVLGCMQWNVGLLHRQRPWY